MARSDPTERLEALRQWFALLAADATKGAARAKEMLESAGDLYDEGSLDGSQYALIYDLGRALRSPEHGDPAELARRCLSSI
jgi:hypothetical protein